MSELSEFYQETILEHNKHPRNFKFWVDLTLRHVRLICVAAIVGVFPTSTFGQRVSDDYCKQIEDVVATPYRPAHFYHKIVFDNECWLEFDIDKKGGTGISFMLVRYANDDEAKRENRSDIEMYETTHYLDRGVNRRMPRIATSGFWSAAYFYDGYGPLLLRRKSTFITLFCDERKLCYETEFRLRQSKLIS